jgi:hypothetical protein
MRPAIEISNVIFHRLNFWLDRGEGYDRIINQIAAIYPGHAEAMKRAVAAKVRAPEAEAARQAEQ